MKVCRECKVEKELTEFGIRRRGDKSTLSHTCKKCDSKKTAEWRWLNPEKVKESKRKFNATHSEKIKAYKQAHRLAHLDEYRQRERQSEERDRERRRLKSKKYALRKYGLTQESYDALLATQGGVCAICKQFRIRKGKGRMPVDHDHKTGAVRGILCDTCNRVLGFLKEDINTLQACILYLEKHLKP